MLGDLPDTSPRTSAYYAAEAALLGSIAYHVGTFDCEAHCEPDGCSTVREAVRLADLILGDRHE